MLKILVDTCYETALFRDALERNADIRVDKIAKLNKAAREEALQRKEAIAQGGKRELAIEMCRKINIENGKGPEAVSAGFMSHKVKLSMPSSLLFSLFSFLSSHFTSSLSSFYSLSLGEDEQVIFLRGSLEDSWRERR